MTTRKHHFAVALMVVAGAWSAFAVNLANPAGMLPAARLSVGASYHLGGYAITDSSIGSVFNRFHLRVAFSPWEYLNFGIDLGTTQIQVDSTTFDSTHYIVFDGKYGFSFGAHLKAATPRFAHGVMSVMGMGEITLFSSKNSKDAEYSGLDGAGALGLQFKIPKFGYVTAGAKMYLIRGDNKSYTGQTGYYWNTDNVQGWLAVDFVPTFKGQMKGNPYFSVEATMVPGVGFGGSVPLKGFSLSLALGWISPRLYGEDFENVE